MNSETSETRETRETIEPWLREIDDKLDRLIAAANMGKGAWWAMLKLGGLLTLIAGGFAWLYDRVRP